MQYLVTINDDELRANGDELSLSETREEIEELLRSGYYYVEHVEPM